MASCTLVSAFGALLRVFYVAFGQLTWDWRPVMWGVAILTMLVGAIIAITQTDVKRLLAYSSIAHAGFMLTGVVAASAAGLSSSLFYLAAYGFTTIGAFAVVTLVRDPAARPRTCPAGPGSASARRWSPGVFAFFLLAFAGIPLTSGFTGKFAVFQAAIAGGALPLVIVGVLSSAIAAFFYVRVIVLMFFSDPAPDGPAVVRPSAFTSAAVAVGAVATAGARRRAAAAAEPGQPRGQPAVRPLSSPAPGASRTIAAAGSISWARLGNCGADRPGCWRRRRTDEGARVITAVPVELTDAALAADVAERPGPGRGRPAGGRARRSDALLTEASAAPDRGRRQAVPRHSWCCSPRSSATRRDPRVVPAAVAIELTHLATLYHDDVMDEADVRRGHPSANSRWDNTVAILTGDFLFARASQILADLGPEAIRIQAGDLRPAGQRPDRRDRRPAARRGPARALPGRGDGQDGLADRHLGPVRRDVLRRPGRAWPTGSRPRARRSGVAFQLSDDILDVASESDQSGKTPGTDLREGVQTLPMLHALRSAGPADARLVELLGRAELTDPRCTPRRWRCCGPTRPWTWPGPTCGSWADMARHEILALPDVPARAAFEALCDFVVERTG